jgi:hypothetical protein
MLQPGTKIKINKYKVTRMNLDDDILNHYISSFFPFFSFPFFFITCKQKQIQKKKYYHVSNTSGSQKLKETLLIIINSQAYHHESPATNISQGPNWPGSKPAKQAAQSSYACIEVSRHQ